MKYIGFGLVGFYGISTIMGYLMYISDIYDLVGFYSIPTIVDYFMSNPLYSYVYIKYIRFGLAGF